MVHKFSIFFVVVFAILISQSAVAKDVSDANISGHVLDAETGEHMPGCVVKILDTNLAAMTDASGHYLFRDLTPEITWWRCHSWDMFHSVSRLRL